MRIKNDRAKCSENLSYKAHICPNLAHFVAFLASVLNQFIYQLNSHTRGQRSLTRLSNRPEDHWRHHTGYRLLNKTAKFNKNLPLLKLSW